MSDCPILQPTLLTIEPGSINIENFIPGRVYKESIKITNTSKIPIIINLRASDKSKLLLNKSLLRIEVNDSKKVDLVIQDKINYSSNKLPITPKTIFILINGEFIEEKYAINLMYFCNNSTFKQKPNYTKKGIPSVYLTQYHNLYPDIKTNRRFVIDKACNIFIRRYENNLVASLKNKINNLMQQISYMQKNGVKLNNNNNNFNYTKTNTSFFIMKDKLDDPQGKFKIDEDIDKNTIIAKNKILLTENLVLSQKIKILEERLSKFETFDNIDYNNYNFNENDNQNYYLKKNNINISNNNYNDNQNNDEKVNTYENENNIQSDGDEQEYKFQDEGKDMKMNDNDQYDNPDNNNDY